MPFGFVLVRVRFCFLPVGDIGLRLIILNLRSLCQKPVTYALQSIKQLMNSFRFRRGLGSVSRGKGKFYQSDVISATGIEQCHYDYGTEIPRKTRGNTAEIPREVKYLAIARNFRGSGNLSPGREWKYYASCQGYDSRFRGIPARGLNFSLRACIPRTVPVYIR